MPPGLVMGTGEAEDYGKVRVIFSYRADADAFAERACAAMPPCEVR